MKITNKITAIANRISDFRIVFFAFFAESFFSIERILAPPIRISTGARSSLFFKNGPISTLTFFRCKIVSPFDCAKASCYFGKRAYHL